MSRKKKSKRKKKKNLQKAVEFSSSITIDEECLGVWNEITDHRSLDRESNYLALIYGENNNLCLLGEDSGGAQECVDDLNSKKSFFILVRGCCIDKTAKKVCPVNIIISWRPKNHMYEGLTKIESGSLMSFHLDYIAEKLQIEEFVFLECHTPEDVTEDSLTDQIKDNSPILDFDHIQFSFTNTVQKYYNKHKKSGYKMSIDPITLEKEYVNRVLCASFLFKEGGGKRSYSIKKRWHKLHANFRVGYYTGKDGKKKGEYSIIGSRVGRGHPDVWKKKGGIGGIFGKGKKETSNMKKENWFYIQTPHRCYCCNAVNDIDVESWLKTLELMGCVRTDIKHGANLEEETGRGSVGDSMTRMMGLSSMIDAFVAENKEEEEDNAGEEEKEAENRNVQVREYEQKISLLENKLFLYEERFSGLYMENKRLREENKQLKEICGIPVEEENEEDDEMYKFMKQLETEKGVKLVDSEEEEESSDDDDDDDDEDDGEEESEDEDDEEEEEGEDDDDDESEEDDDEDDEEESEGESDEESDDDDDEEEEESEESD